MNIVINGYNIWIILLVSFVVCVCLVPLSKVVAKHIGAIDIPNERKVHSKPMPRLGGLAIFLTFLFGYILFGYVNEQMISVLIGGFIIILLGICDDIKPIRARYKLFIQIVAACVVVFYGNILLSNISVLGVSFYFGWFSYPLTVFFILAIINAINLIDGLDGLCSGISAIFFASVICIAVLLDRIYGLDVLLCVIMLGSCLGFLVYNKPPASVFLGDTGSTFLGFIIAIIALLGYKTATFTSLFIPIIVLLLPILDTIFAIIRRFLKGENIGMPDKEHLHHQLLKVSKSTKKTVLIIYAVDILCAVISILYALGFNKIAIILYLILFVIILFLIYKTDILFKHNR